MALRATTQQQMRQVVPRAVTPSRRAHARRTLSKSTGYSVNRLCFTHSTTPIRQFRSSPARYCVSTAMSKLVLPLAPQYLLQAADLYDFEPVGAGAPGWFAAMSAAGTALTFGSFSVGHAGTLEGYNFFEFVFLGRALAASRDVPAAPTRRAFDLSLLRSFETRVCVHLLLHLPPARSLLGFVVLKSRICFIFSARLGSGQIGGTQSLRDRHLLAYGTSRSNDHS